MSESMMTQSCPYRMAIARDIRTFRTELDDVDRLERLRELERPSFAKSIVAAATDVACIGAAWALCAFVSLAFVPLALVVVGNRQRSLGNLLHDGAHGSLDNDSVRAKWLIHGLLGPVLFNVPRIYRTDHFRHHSHLGNPELDVDFIHRDDHENASAWRIFLDNAVSLSAWRGSTFGHLARPGRVGARELAPMALFWCAGLGGMAWAFGAGPAALFLAIWMASRATVFHLITTFREIDDHAGLVPGTLIGFSRNGPLGGPLALFFHPRNNGYHLIHHLNPKIPFHALPRAHVVALHAKSYSDGHHCDGYFSGNHSVIACWRGACRKATGTPAR